MPDEKPTPPAHSEDRREPDPLDDLFQRCKPAPVEPDRRDRLRTFLAAALADR